MNPDPSINLNRSPYGMLETGWAQYYSGSIPMGGTIDPVASNVVFYDLETTGLNPYKDRIIEIGSCRLFSEYTFSYLVNPGRVKIPPKVNELTGITNEMVSKGVPLHIALTTFCDFCGKTAILVAHNNDSFDQRFLEEAFSACSMRIPPGWRFLDSFRIAQKFLPPKSRYGLSNLAQRFDISVKSTHRALPDALTLKQVYPHLIRMDALTAYRIYRKNEFNYIII